MDGMVGQQRDEQVCADSGVGAMPDRAHAEFGLQLPEAIFKAGQSPVSAESLFRFPVDSLPLQLLHRGHSISHRCYVHRSCITGRPHTLMSPPTTTQVERTQ